MQESRQPSGHWSGVGLVGGAGLGLLVGLFGGSSAAMAIGIVAGAALGLVVGATVGRFRHVEPSS